MDSDKIYEEIKNLYNQKKEITLMKKYYLKILYSKKMKSHSFKLEKHWTLGS